MKSKKTFYNYFIGLLQTIYIRKKPMNKLKPVQIRILEVEWLHSNVKNLFCYLASHQDEFIFNNELIKVLLLE